MRLPVLALLASLITFGSQTETRIAAQECNCHLLEHHAPPKRVYSEHGFGSSAPINDQNEQPFVAQRDLEFHQQYTAPLAETEPSFGEFPEPEHGDCCPDKFDPLDTLMLFFGLEGSKQPQDFGANAHFGGRLSANIGLPLSEELGLGIQIGTAINYTDNAVEVFERVQEVRGRSQSYTTLGLFQRHDSGIVWALAWDHLYQSYYHKNHLNQIRGRFGYRLSEKDEFGFRFSASHDSDRAVFNVFGAVPFPVMLEPLSQGSVYWRHSWESQVETTFWVGVAESRGQRNVAFEAAFGLPPQQPSGHDVLFGAEIHVPLNDHWALFGQGNFVTPADTGTVDSYLGFAFYPRGGARRARHKKFAPVIPVANSTSMSIDLR
jgi:hypothetical protein